MQECARKNTCTGKEGMLETDAEEKNDLGGDKKVTLLTLGQLF